ncbi:hypothetical protein AOG26_20325, partial [Pseudoalteromonas sp. UCD-33C]
MQGGKVEIEPPVVQALGEEGGQGDGVAFGVEVAEDRGQAAGIGLEAAEQGLLACAGVEVAVFAPEALQEDAPLAVGEARQVVEAARII